MQRRAKLSYTLGSLHVLTFRKTKLEAHVIELARSISRHGGTLGIAAAGEKRIARMDPHGLLTRGADVECWVSRVIRITNEYIGSRQEGRERRDRFTY